jgi:hypothetical protein
LDFLDFGFFGALDFLDFGFFGALDLDEIYFGIVLTFYLMPMFLLYL